MFKKLSAASRASTAKSAYSVAESMVMCNSGLSWFDYPINRENCNVVTRLLEDLRLPIIAVWLVARPIDCNEANNGGFQHWCVKIQAPSCLISIDFLESKKKGAFGLQTRTDVAAELDDFLYYAVRDPKTGQVTRHKWKILGAVTPSPLKNTAYLVDYLSDHGRQKLIEFIKNHKLSPRDPSKLLKDIQCNKYVCDIASFCSAFAAYHRTGYNPITKNCQQFAAQLFAFLVGDHYMDEVERVFEHFQSPYDKKQWKQYKQQRQERKESSADDSMHEMSSRPSLSLSASASASKRSLSSISTNSPCTPTTAPSTAPSKTHKSRKTKPNVQSKRAKQHRPRRVYYDEEAYSYSPSVIRNCNDDD